MAGGLLLLRIVIGLLLAGHGAQKLFGWFDGPGMNGTTQMFGSLGWRPARAFALLGGLIELVGGILFGAGLFTPVVAGLLAAQMFAAILAVHWNNGLWNTKGGSEYPLLISTIMLALAATGPGRYSLDALTGWWQPSALTGFLTALILAVLGGLFGEATRRVQLSLPKLRARHA